MNEAIATFSIKAYQFLLPISWITLVIALLVLAPLAIIKKTLTYAGAGLFIASLIFGATTWFLGATITFVTYGWIGFIIGLVFLGVGVVPIGIFGAFVRLDAPEISLTLIIMAAVTIGSRAIGGTLADSSE